jgi:hypothetical protein
MSVRLVEAASRALGATTSRRGFLRRAAIAGSAVVAAPATYLLRPGTAYSALVVTKEDCPWGSRCREGWTDFCCTLHGVNTCPPGSIIAGWWRAEGNTYCDGNSRYYMDCNAADCGGCTCGSSGTCSSECAGCACRCNLDRCDHWATCCNRFRYGQCNNQVACVGPIVCRVVTCVPPWEWDSSCTKTDAVSQVTYGHNAACLLPDTTPKGPAPARPAVVDGTTWALRNGSTGGGADSTFTYGITGDVPLMADWTNAGIRTAAVVRGVRHGISGDDRLTWYIRQVEGTGQPDLVVRYGSPGDIPVAGDWDGDGVATIGVVRGNRWLLRNSNSAGPPDIDFVFGQAGDVPVVGDWDGDGRDGPGVVRGNRWLLRNPTSSGPAQYDFTFGSAQGRPVVGDWDGDGRDGPGWFDGGTWQIRNQLTSGGPDRTFGFGPAAGIPLTWHRVAEAP